MSYEDLIGEARPLWRDYSKWQRYVNYDIAVANGVQGMAARAGISWGYIDPFWNYNWTQSEGRMYRTSYHVLYPSQSVLKQADEVWYKAHPERDVIPRVIDLEVSNDQPWSKISDQTRRMSELVLRRDGVRPIIYTRYRLVDTWLRDWTEQEINSHYWWLAQYSWYPYREHSGPPTLPNMMKRNQVVLHQTSDKKRAPIGEVESKSVDWDRWELGNENEMHVFIGQTWGEGTTPPPPPPPNTEKFVKVAATWLNVRDKPEVGARDIGTLHNGTDVLVVEQLGDWYRFEGGWIHKNYVRDK
jgi:hypothetical protein